MSTSYKDLIAKREALEAQIQEARKTELGKAIAEVQSIIGEYGLTRDDVFTVSVRPKARLGTYVVAPKYKDPASGKTWSGRGKAPLWFDKSRPQDFPV